MEERDTFAADNAAPTCFSLLYMGAQSMPRNVDEVDEHVDEVKAKAFPIASAQESFGSLYVPKSNSGGDIRVVLLLVVELVIASCFRFSFDMKRNKSRYSMYNFRIFLIVISMYFSLENYKRLHNVDISSV
jgi:hypothetical protein